VIAISYRREDSLPIAGRLYDRLRAEFGKTEVFMDFDSIPYGMDFRTHIKQTLARADVVVAVIGPSWAGPPSGSTRRIDDPSDFVRLEIAAALERGIPLIPVLINDTPMPAAEALPKELEALAFRNGLALDSGIDFHHHADRLIAGIRNHLKNTPNPAGTAPKSVPDQLHPPPSSRTVALVVVGIIVTALVCLGIIVMQDRLRPAQKENSPSSVVQIPAPAAPSPTAPASVARITLPPAASPNSPDIPFPSDEERVRQLIRDYYSAFCRHDLEAVVENFADIVDYQGEGLRSRQHIRAEAEAYLRRWDRIAFTVGDISVSRRADGDLAASFGFPYTVGSQSSPPITGRSVNQWVLRKDSQGHLRIVFQRETIQKPGR
jgi:ketosteroid isomerase-like protein